MPPTLANGKIGCIEIPANDISRSADFRTGCFGWKMKIR
jgi:predicted enzyme related to lactoylglutathione lyase